MEKKIVSVFFEAIVEDIRKPATNKKVSFHDDAELESFMWGHDLAPDDQSVFSYRGMENGGFYRAIRKIELWERRLQGDNVVLEMEAHESLLQNSQSKSHNAHLHQNLRIYETEDPLSHFDAVVHGDITEETFAIVLEAKTKVRPEHLHEVLEKAAMFQSHLDFQGTLSRKQKNNALYTFS